MTTLDDLMAAGVPDTPEPRHARRTLTAMAIATIAITAAATTALATSCLPNLFAGHHQSVATAPAQQRAPAPRIAPTPGR